MVLKQHALLREPVNVRRQNIRVAHATERVPTLIVGENEKEVGFSCWQRCGSFRRANLTGKSQQSSQGEHG